MKQWIRAGLAASIALALAGVGGVVSSAGTVSSRSGAAYGSKPALANRAPGADNAAIAAILGRGAAASPQVACPDPQCFEDVPSSNPFYAYINRIFQQNLTTGYTCGGTGEPCNPPNNRPYYHPSASVTRGQMAKFLDNARHLPGIDIASDATSGVPAIVASSSVANNAALQGTGLIANSRGVYGLGSGNGLSYELPNLNVGVYAAGVGDHNSVGAVLIASHDVGAFAATSDPSNYYGLAVAQEGGGLTVGNLNSPLNETFIGGPLRVTGGCTGCVLYTIMQNTGPTDLHPGEVVAMSGAPTGLAQLGDQPLVGVDRAQGAYSTSVVGVVAQRWIPTDPSAEPGSKASTGHYDYGASAVKPGEYMGVVTEGAYKEVKVSTANGAIRVGDLLAASAQAGVAMKADAKDLTFGSVIGKAMGTLATGTGTIPLLVTLK